MICLLEEQREVRNKGASMRLGTWPTKIQHGTLAEKIYGSDEVFERHRHRYEFNMKYRDQMREKGFEISGTLPMARSPSWWSCAIIPIFWPANITLNFKANQISRTRYLKALFRPRWRIRDNKGAAIRASTEGSDA